MTTKPLDKYLPIRAITVDGVETGAIDLDLDGDDFAIDVDGAGVGRMTRVNKGALPVDAAAFGTQHTVKSRLLRMHTANATPVAFSDDSDAGDALQVAAGQAADLVGTLIGKKRSSADIYRADIRGTIANNLPTVAALSGDAVTNEVKTGALSSASVAITTDGAGAFVVTVTGVAATDIDWSLAAQVQPIGVIT